MHPKPAAGISGKARETIAKILDHVLRDECSLSATTRQYEWSVTGPNLYSLHRLFDEQRRQLEYWLGQVGQLAKAAGLGGRELSEPPAATGKNAAAGSGCTLPPRTMIGDLLTRHEQMARHLRADIERLGDPRISELLTHLLEFHETSAWMLRMVNGGPGSDQPV